MVTSTKQSKRCRLKRETRNRATKLSPLGLSRLPSRSSRFTGQQRQLGPSSPATSNYAKTLPTPLSTPLHPVVHRQRVQHVPTCKSCHRAIETSSSPAASFPPVHLHRTHFFFSTAIDNAPLTSISVTRPRRACRRFEAPARHSGPTTGEPHLSQHPPGIAMALLQQACVRPCSDWPN